MQRDCLRIKRPGVRGATRHLVWLGLLLLALLASLQVVLQPDAVEARSAKRWSETEWGERETSVRAAPRRMLAFSLDQGFGNGIVENKDSVALKRIISAIKRFEPTYDVYVIISARSTAMEKTRWVMAMLAENNVKFIVDAYASDAMTMGRDAVNAPFDVRHGLSNSLQQIAEFKRDWPQHFAGLRGHEMFSISWTLYACQSLKTNWCTSFAQWMPDDGFYQERLVEPYVAFAAKHGMLFVVSDPFWGGFRKGFGVEKGKDLLGQGEREASLRRLVDKYRDTVVVLYANNEGGDLQWKHMSDWPQVVEPFVSHGALGFGISDQSWICTGQRAVKNGWNDVNCPKSIISRVARDAFRRGALMVQFEPVWYLFRLPRGEIHKRTDYTHDAAWADRGNPTDALREVGRALGVDIPASAAAD